MKFKQLSFFLLMTLFTQSIFISHAYAKDSAAQASPVEVIFKTNMGSFTIELFPDKAPNTVANFLDYVDEGFYSNIIFHRVIRDFVVQAGGFETGMKSKKPHGTIKSEAGNRLKNFRGMVAMARKMHPDTASSQFYINLKHNKTLDYISKLRPGYTVFGKISKGMDIVEKISIVPTTVKGRRDVPLKDVVILSAKRKASPMLKEVTKKSSKKVSAPKHKMERYVEGNHYIKLDKPIATRNKDKVEVIEMFSYGCPHCYEFEPRVKQWASNQPGDTDFWFFPAVWNKPMKLFAKAFYVAIKLDVIKEIHEPLFKAVVIEQKSIRNEKDLADFFAKYGVSEKAFTQAFNSKSVEKQVEKSASLVKSYKPSGAPELVINGKYRIDRMRAGGYEKMLEIADFLINKERALLRK